MTKLFGTDGVRGVAGTELSAPLAQKIGVGAARVLSPRPGEKVLVGRDTRVSGPMLEAAVMSGLLAAGCDVVFGGVLPTPAIAYLTDREGFIAGAVISASHNPAGDNGIKFLAHNGRKLPDELERRIEEEVERFETIELASGTDVGKWIVDETLVPDYEKHAASVLGGRLDGVRIVVDCANGAFSRIAPEVIARLGGGVVGIHNFPNGLNINDGCGSLHPESMREAVRALDAQFGVSFDGDGDRAILCDEKGQIFDGDHVMAACGKWLHEQGRLPGATVVGTVMSNLGLEIALRNEGINLLRAPVGDRYVREEMDHTGAALGGEKSGHVIFGDLVPTGDGLVTALMVMRVMRETGRALSELRDMVKEYPQVLINVPVRTRDGWDEIPEISEAIDAAQRSLSDHGRVVVRPSGTERILRVMVESPEQSEVDRHANAIADAIRAHLS